MRIAFHEPEGRARRSARAALDIQDRRARSDAPYHPFVDQRCNGRFHSGNSFLHPLALAVVLAITSTGLANGAVAVSRPDRPSASGAGNSHLPMFSGDARSVAFLSQANNLVTNDDLGASLDLFVRDLAASNTVLVSVSSNGFGGANRDVGRFALSSNAQVVAFETAAGNLVPGDSNFLSDIFVRDLAAGVTRLVSVSADGSGSGNGSSFNPLLSADGRYVIFESLASNLVTNDFNGTNDVFIRDLLAGTTALASVNAEGTASADGASHSPSVSANGQFVAFASTATNIVPGVTNRAGEIYVRNIAAGSTLWVQSSHVFGTYDPSTRAYRAFDPALSADGRFVAFKTERGALVRFDTLRPTNRVVLAFPPSPGSPATNFFVFQDNPRIVGPLTTPGPSGPIPVGFEASPLAFTPDGRFAAFTTTNASEFQQTLFRREVFRVDMEGFITNVANCCEGSLGQSRTTSQVPVLTIVSTNFAGLAGSFTFVPASTAPAMDTNGELVLFLSNVSNEPGTQPDGRFRLYVRDLSTSAITSFPTNPAGAVVSDIVPVLSPDGTLVAWETAADNLVADDLNDAFDVFVRHLATGETTLVSARHPSRPANTGRGLASVTAGALNANGSRIAFLSGDATLAANDTNRLSDAFLRDFVAGASLPLSAAPFPVMNSPSMPLAQYFPTNSVLNVQLDASGQRALFSGRWTASGSSNHTLVWRDLATGTNLQVAVGPSTPRAVLSPDGRFVFFDTADQVGFLGVPAIGDNFFTLDVLMWNSALTVHDQGSRLSVLSSTRFGTTGNGPSILPLVSPDGCQVAFLSRASDLTLDSAGSTNFQVLARDQFCHPTNYLNGVNRLISYRTVASGAPNGRSFDQPWPTGATNPVFTADSRYLFFQDGASNVIYRHDLLNEFVTRITNVTNNLFATNIARVTNVTVCTDCRSPSVSADGRFLAYEMPGAAGAVNILVKDLATGTTQPVSLNFAGAGFGNGPSYAPLLTHDARFVVFTSKASDLVTGDNNRVADVFLRDLRAGVTFCLSRSAAGNGTGNRVSSNPVLSADGRTIAFQSFASDLVDGDYNDTRDVFVVSLAGPDTDGDSLDDDWEVTYFNDLSRDGSGDFDGDGASDLEEFRAGTDPTNTGSVLRVLQLTRARAGNANNEFFYAVTLLWPTTPGRTYRVQFKETIESPWTDLPGDVTAAGVTGQKLHTPIPSPSQSFYRVALLAP